MEGAKCNGCLSQCHSGHYPYYFFPFFFGLPPFFGKRSRFNILSSFFINPSPPRGLPVHVARLMAACISLASLLKNSLYDLISFSLNQLSFERTLSLMPDICAFALDH